MAKYKLNTKGEIVKTDFEQVYNKEDYTNAVAKGEQAIKELEAQRGVNLAKCENISHFHPEVLDVSEELRNHIWLYHENFVAARELERLIKMIKKNSKDIKAEMKEIEQQTEVKF